MSKVILAGILSDASGKFGSAVFTRGLNGMNMREYVIPANPNSTNQQTVRGNLATINNEWQTALTEAQREAWNSLAAASVDSNSIGQEFTMSGFNLYVRSAAGLLLAGLPLSGMANAPVSASVSLPDPGWFQDGSGTDSLTNGNAITGLATGAKVIGWNSYTTRTTINNYSGPFTTVQDIDIADFASVGNATLDLATTDTPWTSGRVFTKYRLVQLDGGVSREYRVHTDLS